MSFTVTHKSLKKNESNKVYRQQRTYDYLYGKLQTTTAIMRVAYVKTDALQNWPSSFFLDPVYTLSGDVDHARENLKAHTSLDRVVR